jgi:spoIIIJ-associated protein
MLEKTLPRDVHFVIDVNGYHQKKIKSLEDQARLVAERARTFRYDVELPPMTAYERMIVHSTLKEMPDIQTMSHGEGPLRHIVVRFIDPSAKVEQPADPIV